jgi:hypothetical protein
MVLTRNLKVFILVLRPHQWTKPIQGMELKGLVLLLRIFGNGIAIEDTIPDVTCNQNICLLLPCAVSIHLSSTGTTNNTSNNRNSSPLSPNVVLCLFLRGPQFAFIVLWFLLIRP